MRITHLFVAVATAMLSGAASAATVDFNDSTNTGATYSSGATYTGSFEYNGNVYGKTTGSATKAGTDLFTGATVGIATAHTLDLSTLPKFTVIGGKALTSDHIIIENNSH